MALVQDIDMAILTKSLKLLHSPDDDSAEQLLAILEETIKNKYGSKKPINITGLGLNKKASNADDGMRGKRMKLDETSTPSPLYTGAVEDSQTSDSDSDGGVALEILDEDLYCVVCKKMAVGVGNNLVECLECHSLYHQECHNPRIPVDVNDPRRVWYCSNCEKSINKLGSSSKGSPSNHSHSSKQSKGISKSSSSNKSSFNTFSSSSKSSSSNKHSSKNSSAPASITADKRLQIMKKNAAKKQEKRKLSSK